MIADRILPVKGRCHMEGCEYLFGAGTRMGGVKWSANATTCPYAGILILTEAENLWPLPKAPPAVDELHRSFGPQRARASG